MTRLLLVEDVFLLAHDDESGRNTASVGLQGALVGALLLDLAERGLVTVVDGRVEATGATTDDPLLGRAVQAIRDEPHGRKVGHWLGRLARELKPLDRTVGESLVARGVLDEQRGKVLGVFSTTRWPERDPAPERELRAELRGALLGEAEPTTRVLLLAGVLDPYGMVDGLVEKPERKQARARAEEFARRAEAGDGIAAGIADNVRAAQAAVTAAVMASTAATVASTTVAGSN